MIISWPDFIAGCLGGMAGVFVGHPVDTVKVRQQTLNVQLRTAIKLTYRCKGIRGFFNGMMFPLLTIGPSNSLFFGVYASVLKQTQYNKTAIRVIFDDTHWISKVYFAGCVGGLVQVIASCPTEIVKTALQSNIDTGNHEPVNRIDKSNCSGMISCIRTIVGKRGILGMYRGFWPMFYRDVPTSGIYTVVYEHYIHSMSSDQTPMRKPEFKVSLMAGGLAGVISWVFVVPLDVVKSRIQGDTSHTQKYHGMMQCFRDSYRTDGLPVFFKGFWAIIIRAFVVHAVTIAVYAECLSKLEFAPSVIE